MMMKKIIICTTAAATAVVVIVVEFSGIWVPPIPIFFCVKGRSVSVHCSSSSSSRCPDLWQAAAAAATGGGAAWLAWAKFFPIMLSLRTLLLVGFFFSFRFLGFYPAPGPVWTPSPQGAWIFVTNKQASKASFSSRSVCVGEELGGSSIWRPWFHFYSFMCLSLENHDSVDCMLFCTRAFRATRCSCCEHSDQCIWDTQRHTETEKVCVCLEMMISYMGFSFTSSEYLRRCKASMSCL